MKKYSILTALFLGLALSGCRGTPASPPPDTSAGVNEAGATMPEPSADTDEDLTVSPKETEVVQGGPYGRISLSLPAEWRYETYPVDSGTQAQGLYGIRFYPENVTDGYVELAYIDRFGVCGTGLTEEARTIADTPASVGTYDNHAYWDFIAFRDAYDGLVAFTSSVEDWWAEYELQIWDILDTVSFDSQVREGAVCVYNPESELSAIGLSLSLKNISPTGATLVFYQYDTQSPAGSLSYGDDFTLEVQKNDVWESVPTILETYGFNSIAYCIPAGETVEQPCDWSWLYGTLAPGSYRIKKSVLNSGNAGADEYIISAYFILN